MNNMSRMATGEYIGAKRRAYAQSDRARRMHILDDVCETTGYERKYANRLLTGNRKFREHRGRGRTYGDDVAEVLNHHVAAYLGSKAKMPFLWRSRPRHSNDNTHMEEKNRSSGRQFFGEIRLDCPSLYGEFVRLCDDWSDSRNFFCPCRMLVSKEKRPDGKGYRCRYDKPRAPCQSVLDEHVLSSPRVYRAGFSGKDPYRRVLKRLRKTRRIQAAYARAKHEGKDLSPFAARPSLALRATPSGTAGLHREGTRHAANDQRMSHAEERGLSTQYLATPKAPSYLQSAFPI